jgi:hypothetical protein
MSDDIFDFGFTAVDEDELQAVQSVRQEASEASETADAVQAKLDKLYNAVTPLLTNLKKNPEKEYIYWPNRKEKLEEQVSKIVSLTRG